MQGRGFHPWSGKIPLASDPHAPQLLSLCSRVREPQLLNLCAPATEACAPRAQAPQQEKPPQQEAPRPTRKSSPHSLPLEKAHGQQGRPRAAKEKKKKTTNNKCCQGRREKGVLVHCWWEGKLVQLLWKTGRQSLKNINQNYHTILQIHFWVLT